MHDNEEVCIVDVRFDGTIDIEFISKRIPFDFCCEIKYFNDMITMFFELSLEKEKKNLT